jgi:hypothetical protein
MGVVLKKTFSLLAIVLFIFSQINLALAGCEQTSFENTQYAVWAGGTVVQSWSADSGYLSHDDIGTESVPAYCSNEGQIYYQFRGYGRRPTTGFSSENAGENPADCSAATADWTYSSQVAASGYTVNWDGDQTDCECYGKSWSIGGEVASTTCCGDDAGEYVNLENTHSESIAFDNNENACCDSDRDCVSGSTCYTSGAAGVTTYTGLNGGGNDDIAHCYNNGAQGNWLECDQSDYMDYWCGNHCGPAKGVRSPRQSGTPDPDWNAVASGETVAHGEYATGELLSGTGDLECCGDDPDEYYRYYDVYNTQYGMKFGDDDTSDDACCNDANDCVYDGLCYDQGYYDLDGDGRKSMRCYTDGRWLEVDYHTSYCTANGYSWNLGGDALSQDSYYTANGASPDYCNIGSGGHPSQSCCCGDDTGENVRTRTAYTTDSGNVWFVDWGSSSSDDACCDSSTDCVYNSVCYAYQGVLTGVGSGDDQTVVCHSDGRWLDCDGDSSRCGQCGLSWLATGDGSIGEYSTQGHSTTSCCGDDASEYVISEDFHASMDGTASGTVCCNSASDCTTGTTCVANTGSSDADGDGDTDYCSIGSWLDCNSDSNCATGSGYHCVSNNCVNTCSANSQCPSGFYCSSGGVCTAKKSNGVTCDGITYEGTSISENEACSSGYCDNDGVGASDDNWCFTPSGNYDNQDNKCEESANSGLDNNVDEYRNECRGSSGFVSDTCGYTTDGDSNSNTCTCVAGSSRWSLGGETASTNCCGDDASENKVTSTLDAGIDGSVADLIACCNPSTDCAYANNCVATGSSVDIDSDGDTDYCGASNKWYDCNSDSNCPSGTYCSSGDCVACTASQCGTNANCRDGTAGCCDAHSDCSGAGNDFCQYYNSGDENGQSSPTDDSETEGTNVQLASRYVCAPAKYIDRGNRAGMTFNLNTAYSRTQTYMSDINWWQFSGDGMVTAETSYTTGDTDLCFGYNYDPCSLSGTSDVVARNAAGTRYDLGDIKQGLSITSGCSTNWIWIDLSSYLGASNGIFKIAYFAGDSDYTREWFYGWKTSEAGAVDGSSSTWCCDDSTDCVDDAPTQGNRVSGSPDSTSSGCYDTTSTHDTGAGDGSDLEYCSSGTWVAADASSTACSAVAGSSRWNLGGETASTTCCGDDANENKVTSISDGSMDSAIADLVACCNPSTDCAASNICTTTGSSRDADGDGDTDYCGASNTWFDCNDDSNCPSGTYCSSGDCVACTLSQCSTNPNCRDGTAGCCDADSDCTGNQYCDDGDNSGRPYVCENPISLSRGSIYTTDIGSTGNDVGFLTNPVGTLSSACIRYDVYDAEDSTQFDINIEHTKRFDALGGGNEAWLTNYYYDISSYAASSTMFEFDAQTNGHTYDNILFGYLVSEAGAVDGASSTSCCDDSTDCVDDYVQNSAWGCYDTTSTHDTGAGDGSDLEYCSSGTWVAADASSTACSAVAGSSRWNLGGETASTTCCGDDANENKVTSISDGSMDSAIADLVACCNPSTDCAASNICTTTGSSRDADGDGDTDYCGASNTWFDCNDDSNCVAGSYCSSNNCASVATPTLTLTPIPSKPLNSELTSNLLEISGSLPGGYQYKIEQTQPSSSTIYTGTSTSYTHDDLNDNDYYCYRARTEKSDQSHYSSWSSTVCTTDYDRTKAGNVDLDLTPVNDASNRIDAEVNEIEDGLVLYLPFEEGSGSIAYDWSQNNFDGTNSGASYSTGNTDVGTGGSLDFSSDYVQISNDATLNPQYITFSAWLYFDTVSGSQQIYAKRSSASAGNFWLYNSGGTLYFDTYADGSQNRFTISSFFSAGSWIHLAVTYDGTTKKVYKNGVLIDSNTDDSGTLTSVSTDVFIGKDSTADQYYFDGKIDELRVYNKALTQEEVINVMNSGLPSHYVYVSETSTGTYNPLNLARNCNDLYNDGIVNDGVYLIDSDGEGSEEPTKVYCDMTSDNEPWTLIFNHDIRGGYWSGLDTSSYNRDEPNSDLYSILDQLENFREEDGKFTMKINWPDLGLGSNVWRQSSNPVPASARGVTGYEAVDIDYTSNSWGGLEKDGALDGTNTFLDGSVDTTTWYYSIGSKAIWSTGLPSYSPAAEHVQLWVKGDSYVGENNAPVQVENGDAETGDTTNFNFDTVSSDAYTGDYSFSETSSSTVLSTDLIPIDENVGYKLSGWLKSTGAGGNSRVYFGFAPYDENKTAIMNYEVHVIGGTETTLYSDVQSSDSIVNIVDCTNWYTLSHARMAFNVDDSGSYSDLPNRDLSNQNIIRVEDVGDHCEIEFGTTVGKSYSAGTKVRMHVSGSGYMYSAAENSYIPSSWTYYESNTLKGNLLSGAGYSTQFWPGTKFVKVLFLANYQQDSTYTLLADDINIRIIDESNLVHDTTANDNTDPNEVTGLSDGSHATSTWSNDASVDFSWTSATDDGDDYYYYVKSLDKEGNENNLYTEIVPDVGYWDNTYPWSDYIPVNSSNYLIVEVTASMDDVTGGTNYIGGFIQQYYDTDGNHGAYDETEHWQDWSSPRFYPSEAGQGYITKTHIYIPNYDYGSNVGLMPSTNHVKLGSFKYNVDGTPHIKSVKVYEVKASTIISGLNGYDSACDTSSGELSSTSIDLDSSKTSYTCSFAQGQSNYFHLKSVDKVGNWDDTSADIGPYWICLDVDGVVDSDADDSAGTVSLTDAGNTCGCDSTDSSTNDFCDNNVDGTKDGRCVSSSCCTNNVIASGEYLNADFGAGDESCGCGTKYAEICDNDVSSGSVTTTGRCIGDSTCSTNSAIVSGETSNGVYTDSDTTAGCTNAKGGQTCDATATTFTSALTDEGRCVLTSCCTNSEVASGETSGSVDWTAGDEACGCGTSNDGEICDNTATTFGSALSAEGACIDNGGCCTTDVVSGETSSATLDNDETCGCVSGTDNGKICDSDPNDGLEWDGICSAGTCYTSGNMVDTDQDGDFDTYGCIASYNGALCDSNFDGVVDGVCVGTSCDVSVPVELDCGVDGCSNADMGNTAYVSCQATTGNSCDNSFGSFTNYFFTQYGTCTADGCDTSGHLCFDDTNYQSGCSLCSRDYDVDPQGDACDSSVLGGDYVANGLCINDGSCDTNGEICADSGTGNSFMGDCSDCASESICQTGVTTSFSANGMCADTDNNGATDSCVTGAVCRDSENSNILKDACNECISGSDWDSYDSNGGTSFVANGICTSQGGDTTGEACFTGAAYMSDCSSCSNGNACDSDITNGAYSADGICSDGNCCTSYVVDVNNNAVFDDASSCGACASSYNGYRCDSNSDGTWDGVCAYTGATWQCDTDTVFFDGSYYRTVRASDGSTDGKKCENGAIGSNAFTHEGYGIDSGSCDTVGVVAQDCGSDSNQACAGTEPFYDDCDARSSAADSCDSSITSGDNWAQTGICINNGQAFPHDSDLYCDSANEVVKSGTTYYNDCADNSALDGAICDSNAASGGDFNPNGLCIYSISGTGTSTDCDTDEVCFDGANYQNDCSACGYADVCQSDVTGSTFSADGVCGSASNALCCTDYASDADNADAPSQCGTQSAMCNDQTENGYYCDDVSDAGWLPGDKRCDASDDLCRTCNLVTLQDSENLCESGCGADELADERDVLWTYNNKASSSSYLGCPAYSSCEVSNSPSCQAYDGDATSSVCAAVSGHWLTDSRGNTVIDSTECTMGVTCGDGSGPFCCEDDAGENYGTCVDSSANGACGVETDACCDASNDCVDHNAACQDTGACYNFGGTYNSFCNAGSWEDPDESQSYCEASGCSYTWISGASLCCGDDLTNDDFENSGTGNPCCINGETIASGSQDSSGTYRCYDGLIYGCGSDLGPGVSSTACTRNNGYYCDMSGTGAGTWKDQVAANGVPDDCDGTASEDYYGEGHPTSYDLETCEDQKMYYDNSNGIANQNTGWKCNNYRGPYAATCSISQYSYDEYDEFAFYLESADEADNGDHFGYMIRLGDYDTITNTVAVNDSLYPGTIFENRDDQDSGNIDINEGAYGDYLNVSFNMADFDIAITEEKTYYLEIGMEEGPTTSNLYEDEDPNSNEGSCTTSATLCVPVGFIAASDSDCCPIGGTTSLYPGIDDEDNKCVKCDTTSHEQILGVTGNNLCEQKCGADTQCDELGKDSCYDLATETTSWVQSAVSDEKCGSTCGYSSCDATCCEAAASTATVENAEPCTDAKCTGTCSSGNCLVQINTGYTDCDADAVCLSGKCYQSGNGASLSACDTESGAICDTNDDSDMCVPSNSCAKDSNFNGNLELGDGYEASGSTSFDVDNDGDNDYCDAGVWKDCSTDDQCLSGQYCSAGDCLTCTTNECSTHPNCRDGTAGCCDLDSECGVLQYCDDGDDVNSVFKCEDAILLNRGTFDTTEYETDFVQDVGFYTPVTTNNDECIMVDVFDAEDDTQFDIIYDKSYFTDGLGGGDVAFLLYQYYNVSSVAFNGNNLFELDSIKNSHLFTSILYGYLISENGAVDVSNSISCCDNSTDCVDDYVVNSAWGCFDTGSLRDTGAGDGADLEECRDSVWYSQDSDALACMNAGNDWNIGGELDPTTCCEDDSGEYSIFSNEDTTLDGAIPDISACCDAESDCGAGNVCTPFSSSYDADLDGDTDYCGASNTWYDCNDDTNCPSGTFCSNNDCIACTTSECLGHPNCRNGDVCCDDDSECGAGRICVSEQINQNPEFCSYTYQCRNVESATLGSVININYSHSAFFGGDSSGSGNCGDHAYSVPSNPDGDLCLRYNGFDADGSIGALVVTTNHDTNTQSSSPASGGDVWAYNYIYNASDSDSFHQLEIRTYDTGFGSMMYGYYVSEVGAVDVSSSTGCCDQITDCVDDALVGSAIDQNGCFDTETTRDTGGGDGIDLEYCNLGTWIAADADSTACTAVAGANLWNLGGEINPTTCCGDDVSENKIVSIENSTIDIPIADLIACCDLNSDCGAGNVCTPFSSSYDADLDGDTDYCGASNTWFDCNDDTNCHFNEVCTNNECDAVDTPTIISVISQDNLPLNSEKANIEINWSGSLPSGYVYRLEELNHVGSEIYENSDTFFSHGILDDNLEYCYRVRIQDSSGDTPSNYGPWSSTVCDMAIDRTKTSNVEVELTSQNNSNNRIDTEFNDVKDGLVLYLPFEEGSGSNAYDYSQYDNHATIDGATYTDGVDSPYTGNALSFSNSDFVTSSYNHNSNIGTFSYWVNYDSLANALSGQHDGTSKRFYLGISSSGNLFAGYGDSYSSSLSTPVTITPGEWYYLTMSGDGSIAKLYVNGVYADEFAYSFSGSSTVPIKIGDLSRVDSTHYYVNGKIDEVRVYDKALTQEEIIDDMQSGLIRYGLMRAESSTGTYEPVFGYYDDFTDNDYTNNPTWTEYGSDTLYGAENGQVYLQSTGSGTGGLQLVENINSNESFIFEGKHNGASENGFVVGGRYIRRLGSSYQVDGVYVEDDFRPNWKVVFANDHFKFYTDDILVREWDASSDGTFKIYNDQNTASSKLYYDNIVLTPLVESKYLQDTQATDVSDPNEVTSLDSTSHNEAEWSNDPTVDLSWVTATDNGDDYFYYLKSFDSDANENSLFANGGFETDSDEDSYPDSWSKPAYASRSSDSYDGDYSVHVGYNSGNWAGINQCLNYGSYEVGQAYRVDLKFKCTTGSAAIFFGDDINYGKWDDSVAYGSSSCDGSWKSFGRYLYMDSDQPTNGHLCVYVYGMYSSSDDILYDDIVVTKIESTTITSGLDGYGVSCDLNSGDNVSSTKTLEEVSVSYTCDYSQGQSNYFHITSLDYATNWDDSSADIGPYWICLDGDGIVDSDADDLAGTVSKTDVDNTCGCSVQDSDDADACDVDVDGTADGYCVSEACCTGSVTSSGELLNGVYTDGNEGCGCGSRYGETCDSDAEVGLIVDDGHCIGDSSCSTSSVVVSGETSNGVYTDSDITADCTNVKGGQTCDNTATTFTSVLTDEGRCVLTDCCLNNNVASGDSNSASLSWSEGDESCGCVASQGGNICDSSSLTFTDSLSSEGRCVDTACCLDNVVVSGEYNSTGLSWSEGDESCGCSVLLNSQICDSSSLTFADSLSSEGRCVDTACCLSSDTASGETSGTTDYTDGDESCGCSVGNGGEICDSSSLTFTDSLSSEGRCILTSCCMNSETASGETSGSIDWIGGDESCGCGTDNDGEICDNTATTFGSVLSAEGACIDNGGCCTTDVVSGETSSATLDNDETCGCTALTNGNICDSDPNDGLEWDGVCAYDGSSWSCDVSDVWFDGTYYRSGSDSPNTDGYPCESGLVGSDGFTQEGLGADNVCDLDSHTECGFGAGNNCDLSCDSTNGYMCTTSLVSGLFSQTGTCTSAGCDTVGHVCFDEASYNNDCSLCTIDYDVESEGDTCDSSVLGGNYNADGLCTVSGCDTDGDVCVDSLSGNAFEDDCSKCTFEDICQLGSTISFVADGMCADTDNNGLSDSCVTGAVCRDSENSNILKDACDCVSGNDWDSYDSDGGTSFVTDGICTSQGGDTIDEACYTGALYMSDCSSCSNGNFCDSDITNGIYLTDGMCTSGNCCVGYYVDTNNNGLFDDASACDSCSPSYNGYKCDSGSDNSWDGVCAYDGSSWSCDVSDVWFDGTYYRSGSDSPNTDGYPCESGLVGSDGFTQEGLGADDICDLDSHTECGFGAGNNCDLSCDSTNGYMCTTSLVSGLFSQTGTCTSAGCDTIGHVCFDESSYNNDCSLCTTNYDVESEGDTCDSSVLGGNYNADGLCTISGCDTDGDVCVDQLDSNDFKDDCSLCGEGSICQVSSTVSFSANGHCDGTDCCNTNYVDINGNILYDDGAGSCVACSVTTAFRKCSNDGDFVWDGVCFDSGSGYICDEDYKTCNFFDSVMTGLACENSDIDSSYIDMSFIYDNTINDSDIYSSYISNVDMMNSTIRNSNINDSLIVGSVVNISNIIDSKVRDSELCSGLTLIDASIVDNVIISGSVSYLGINYYSPTTIDTVCSARPPYLLGYVDINNTVVKYGDLIKVRYVSDELGNSVKLNASDIGQGSSITLYDDGTNGDSVSDDGTYTNVVSVNTILTKNANLNVTIDSKWSVSESLYIDNTYPDGSLSVVDLESGDNITYSKNVLLHVDAFDNYELLGCRFANENVSDLNTAKYEECLSQKEWKLKNKDGVRTVFMEVTDYAGNSVIYNDTILYLKNVVQDTTPPTQPIVFDEGDYTNSLNQLTFDWYNSTDRENQLLFIPLKYDYKLWNGTNYILERFDVIETFATITNLSLVEGLTYRLDVWAKNAAGLYSEKGTSDGIIPDYTNPSLVTISANLLENNWTNIDSVQFNFSATDSISGVYSYSYSVDILNSTNPDNIVENSNNLTISSLADGTYYLKVKAVDNAGNIGDVSSFVFKIDNTAPTIPQMSKDYEILTQGKNISVEWSSSSDICGISSYWLQISTSPDFEAENIVFNQDVGDVLSYVYNAVEGGNYYARVKAQNNVGLWSVYSQIYSSVVDNEPPVITVVKPVGDIMSNSPIVVVETNELAVCSYSLDSGSYVTFESTKSKHHESLIDVNNGNHVVDVLCVDGVGNSATDSTNFDVDNTLNPDTLVINPGSETEYFAGETAYINFTLTDNSIPVGEFDLTDLDALLLNDHPVGYSFADIGFGIYSLSFRFDNLDKDYDFNVTIYRASNPSINDSLEIVYKKTTQELCYNLIDGSSSLCLGLPEEPLVKTRLVYDDVSLDIDTPEVLSTGIYYVKLKNTGVDEDGNPIVKIELVSQFDNLDDSSVWVT